MYRTEVGSTISRPASTAILAIDGEDRYTNYLQARVVQPFGSTTVRNNAYSFSITRNQSALNGFMTRIGVTEVVLPWCIPNINPKTNKMTIRIGGGFPEIFNALTIPPGFYTPSQLASYIQAYVRTLDVTLVAFTMTYGTNGLPLFEYNTNNAGVSVQFAPLPYNSTAYPYPDTTKQLFDLLGFNDSNNLPVFPPGGVDYTGGNTFCQAIRYVDIVCTQLTGQQSLRDTTTQPIARDMLARIYLNGHNGEQSAVSASSSTFCPAGCAPFTIYRDFSLPKQIEWSPEQPVPGVLRFDVFDDSGAPLAESDPFSPGEPTAPPFPLPFPFPKH